ncbi:hypothetical protein ACFL6U_10525, partial [Planctomycetota bacterium]
MHLFEDCLIGVWLTVLALRVTVTEGPPVVLSNLSLNLSDPLYSLLISSILFLIPLVWWCRHAFFRGPAYQFTGLEPGLALLFIAGLLSSFAAANQRLAINQMIVFFTPALAALVLAQLLQRPQRQRLVLIFLVTLGVLSSVQSLTQQVSTNNETIRQYEENPSTFLEPLGIEPDTL